METFGLKLYTEAGKIRSVLREAILEGHIRNEYEEAFAFMLETGRKMGLVPVKV